MGHVLQLGTSPARNHPGMLQVHIFSSSIFNNVLMPIQMGNPARGLWKAAHLATGHPCQACGHDRAGRERAELAGEHHISNDSYGKALVHSATTSCKFLSMFQSYKQQAQKLAGYISLLFSANVAVLTCEIGL